MLGIIVFFSTTTFFSPILNLLLLPLILCQILLQGKLPVSLNSKQLFGFVLIVISIILSFLLFIFIDPQVENFQRSILGNFPYLVLVLVSVMIGSFFKRKDLDFILLLVLVEIFIGCLEYHFGVNSFFVSSKGSVAFGTTDLFYYNRAYGLSENSSVLAFKVLIAVMILMCNRLHYSKKFIYFSSLFLCLGFFVTFNRTAIIACIVGVAIMYGRSIKTLLLGVLTLASFLLFNWEIIKYQLFRGYEHIDLSGRDFIYTYFVSFITDNPIVGNSGVKIWEYFGDKLYHAHNSYLELFASNGIVVSSFFMLGYYLIFSKARLMAVPIIVYSFFQYGLFWGFVFHDIVISAIFFTYISQLKQPVLFPFYSYK